MLNLSPVDSPHYRFQRRGPSRSALARIHRRTALGTALEEARGCSSESGIMVLEQKPARKQGAPNRCCHRTNPTVSASSLTTIAWWPMPACSCRPPSPGTWACENSSTITLTSAARRDGRSDGSTPAIQLPTVALSVLCVGSQTWRIFAPASVPGVKLCPSLRQNGALRLYSSARIRVAHFRQHYML